jgi:hypothetical protein
MFFDSYPKIFCAICANLRRNALECKAKYLENSLLYQMD